MKTLSTTKKLAFALLTLVFALGLIFGVNSLTTKKAYADEEPVSEEPATVFQMIESASIRTNSPNGIRFTTEIGNNDLVNGAAYYTVIYPTAKLNGKSIKQAIEDKDIDPDTDSLVVVALIEQAFNKLDFMNDGYVYYHAVLIGKNDETDLPELLWGKQLTAQTYYTTDEGVTKTWTENTISRSIAYIAAAELADGFEQDLYHTIMASVLGNTELALDGDKTVLVGGTATFALTAAPTDDCGRAYPVKWATSDETIATVDENGNVTAVAAGSATITASIGNYSATATITVKNELSLAKSTFNLFKNSASANHTATPAFKRGSADESTPNVTWSDAGSNSSVATINAETGVITAVGYGTTTFTATSNEAYDNGKQFTVTVNVDLPAMVAPLSTEYSNISIFNNKAITAYDTAYKYGDETGSLRVTLNASSEIYLSLTNPTTKDLTDYNYIVYRVYNDTNANVSMGVLWAADTVCAPGEWTEVVVKLATDNIDTVGGADIPKNNVTGLALRVISGTNGSNVYISNVIAKVHHNTFITNGNGNKITSDKTFVGGTTELKIYQDNAEYTGGVTWTTSDASIATVSGGTVTGVAEGTATITATTADGETASAVITVGSALRLNYDSLTLFTGDVIDLSVMQGDEEFLDEIAWESTDEGVATVDENGNVTAVAAGSATIRATIGGDSENSLEATISVYDAVKSILSFADQSASRKISVNGNLSKAVDTSVTAKSVTETGSDEYALKVVHYGYLSGNSNYMTITTPDNTDISAYNYVGFDVYNPTGCRWVIGIGNGAAASNGEATTRQVKANATTRIVWPISYFDGANERASASNVTNFKLIIFSVTADVKTGDALWFSSIRAYGRESAFDYVTSTDDASRVYNHPDDNSDESADSDTFTIDANKTLIYAFSQNTSDLSMSNGNSLVYRTDYHYGNEVGSTRWQKNSGDGYLRLDRVLSLSIQGYTHIVIRVYNPHDKAFEANFIHGGYTWVIPKQWTEIKVPLAEFNGQTHETLNKAAVGDSSLTSLGDNAAWNFQVFENGTWSGKTINGNFTNIRYMALRMRPVTGTIATDSTVLFLSDLWAIKE